MKRVLLVEDEAIIAAAEKEILDAEGYETEVARSGEDAVDRALSANPAFDLVLMDINLGPGIDGTEAARRILAERPVPLLFLSSHVEPDVVEAAESVVGSYGYVVKNSGQMVLLASIRMAFRLSEANAALRAGEARYRALFAESEERASLLRAAIAQSSNLYAVVDRERRYRMVNDAFCRYQGMAERDILGCEARELVGERAWSRIEAMMEEAFSGSSVSFRMDREYPQLGRRALSVRYDPVRDSAGKVVYVSATIVDVTDDETHHDEIRRLEIASKLLVEYASEGIALADSSGKVLVWNDALARLTGIDGEDARGLRLWELISELEPADGSRKVAAEVVERAIRDLLASDAAGDGETPRRMREANIAGFDGFSKHVEEHVFRFEADGRPYAGAILRDVTDRFDMERRLAESEERFRLAVDATSDGLWDWDIPSGRVYRSPAYWRMLGYPPDPPIGTFDRWADLVHPDDRAAAVAANEETVRGHRDGFAVEYRMLAADGSWRWILGRGKAAYRDETGRAVRIVGTHTDITGIKEVQAELERSVRDKTVLMRELQHRVKNNLMLISSMLSIEKERVTQCDARGVLVDCIARVGTVQRLYEQLYRSDRVDHVDLGRYLQEVARGALAAIPGAAVALEFSADPLRAFARRAVPLGIMLNELVTNARKYAWPESRGGTLRVSLRSDGSRVALEVADDGAGTSGLSRETEGTGLRLIRMLAEQLDGSLSVDSSRGFKARIEFPGEVLEPMPPAEKSLDRPHWL